VRLDRVAASYAYFATLGIAVVVFNALVLQYRGLRADNVLEVLFFVLASPVLSLVEVRLDRGRLTLSGLSNGAAVILLGPLSATIAGLAMGFGMIRRGYWTMIANSLTTAAANFVASLSVVLLQTVEPVTPVARLLGILIMDAVSVSLVALALSIRSGEPISRIAKQNFTQLFFVAYGYLTLGAFLISYLVNGSAMGYMLTVIVFALALTLTDTVAGRRVRRVLESELSDADRHLFHSRAVEGVVHNLRNHMATAVGYLKEIDLKNLNPVDRDAVETATAAANDAVTVLRTLSQGATPRVSYANEPVDLNELATRAIAMARPRAHAKAVELALQETTDEVRVKADPLLLREVLTNLINNAIDAAPNNGHVLLSTGRRNNGWPYFSVADDGPGVAEENRHHLFEPHFTTKETGTGLGLFMSYGIVREHQGDLLYSGSGRGAVFTVTLPPFT
jgi:signal transduction histidine kinase